MTTDEVLDILGDPRIPCVRKPPFVRFLLGVYNSDPLYDKENQEWYVMYMQCVYYYFLIQKCLWTSHRP